MIEELQQKVGKQKVGDVKQPDAALVETIKSKVSAKIREVKGKPGKALACGSIAAAGE